MPTPQTPENDARRPSPLPDVPALVRKYAEIARGPKGQSALESARAAVLDTADKLAAADLLRRAAATKDPVPRALLTTLAIHVQLLHQAGLEALLKGPARESHQALKVLSQSCVDLAREYYNAVEQSNLQRPFRRS